MASPSGAWAALRNKLASGFSSLQGSPRDLYLVFVLKVLESYNYFSLSRILTLYLTEEFGVGDVRAGTIYGLWGTLLTLYGLFLGGAIDALGVKPSLILCFLLNVSSRFVMAYTSTPWLLLGMLLGPNTVAGSLGVPVMTIAVKRFTTTANRGFAFSLFYTLMNLAALSQGVLLDLFRITFKHGFDIKSLPTHHLLNNGTRLFLVSGCFTSLAGFVISCWLADAPLHGDKPGHGPLSREGASSSELELPSSSTEALLIGESNRSGSQYAATLSEPHQTARRPFAAWLVAVWSSVHDVVVTAGFWKFLAMCIYTVNLKGIFRHLDATLPKYQLRAFGCDVPIGLIYSINPLMIVTLVPIVGAVTTAYAHFDMIHLGSYISALSPLLIVTFNTEWSTAAFVAVLSLGEAVWSPRWYDYSMSVAPDGKEGIFTALTSAPLFAAMLPTGVVSGLLLQRYCPDAGQCMDAVGQPAKAAAAAPLHAASECNGRTLWAIILAITMTTPLLITLTQRWVRPAPANLHPLRHVVPTGTELEPGVDVNEADPLAVLEHVCQTLNCSEDETAPLARNYSRGL